MRTLIATSLVGGLLTLTATGAFAQNNPPAQANPQQQPGAPAQAAKCCCEQMMKQQNAGMPMGGMMQGMTPGTMQPQGPAAPSR